MQSKRLNLPYNSEEVISNKRARGVKKCNLKEVTEQVEGSISDPDKKTRKGPQ